MRSPTSLTTCVALGPLALDRGIRLARRAVPFSVGDRPRPWQAARPACAALSSAGGGAPVRQALPAVPASPEVSPAGCCRGFLGAVEDGRGVLGLRCCAGLVRRWRPEPSPSAGGWAPRLPGAGCCARRLGRRLRVGLRALGCASGSGAGCASGSGAGSPAGFRLGRRRRFRLGRRLLLSVLRRRLRLGLRRRLRFGLRRRLRFRLWRRLRLQALAARLRFRLGLLAAASGSGAGCASGSGAGCAFRLRRRLRLGSGAGCASGSGAGCGLGLRSGCASGSGAGAGSACGAGSARRGFLGRRLLLRQFFVGWAARIGLGEDHCCDAVALFSAPCIGRHGGGRLLPSAGQVRCPPELCVAFHSISPVKSACPLACGTPRHAQLVPCRPALRPLPGEPRGTFVAAGAASARICLTRRAEAITPPP